MIIKNNNYIYSTEVKNNNVLRGSFNRLTKNTFAFDFEEWYQAGYWEDLYIPHVMLDGDKVVSDISVNIMQFDLCGVKKNYIQLGTVMTDDNYKGQGLNSIIMQNVLKEYQNKVDGIYLFANNSALDYYPKFGFKPSKEYEYFMPCNYTEDLKPYKVNKLCAGQPGHIKQLYNIIKNFLDDTENINQNDGMYMSGNPGLYQFWMMAGFENNIYYLPENKVYIVAKLEGNILYIYQVFGKKKIEVKRFVKSFGENVTEAVFGYTPVNKEDFQVREHKEDDCTLFIMGESLQSIEMDKMLFPVLSHA